MQEEITELHEQKKALKIQFNLFYEELEGFSSDVLLNEDKIVELDKVLTLIFKQFCFVNIQINILTEHS